MPLVESRLPSPPPLLSNGHAETLFAGLLRRSPQLELERERLELPDGDFLDLDWSRNGSRRLALLTHGLEGHSRRPYVLGMARTLRDAGFDVLARNLRGCSGELNRLATAYHSGETGDLDQVLGHALATGGYESVVLVGFSIGGNQTLRYLGEDPDRVPGAVAASVCISVPCDLPSSERELARRSNRIYVLNFLKTLREKLREKNRRFPGLVDPERLEAVRDLRSFDDLFTAPSHGFRDAAHYYVAASSRPVLGAIRVPTLLLNARNDPFLPPECFPEAEARANPMLFLETPARGGHVGFVPPRPGLYRSEARTLEFLARVI
ncbi:MAG TPA: alpha/beta fold hydrolase [Desulfovibrio sp.]|uniref:YheT family hydrolase n=1 Tax=Desulfovibrio sp. TaxID=885 RepID=UPI002B921DD0|nr:alpha/beta fold hydrolase [Desulfovibrio sp.]HMM39129.1 alpha/beta fold hydrolase [Desulfovibrio sp.]